MKVQKITLVSAAIYSVIIGLIFVALSVLALLARNCTLDMTGSPLTYMMFLLYFRVLECKGRIDFSLLDIETTVTAVIPDEASAVNRTFIFAFVYAGLYGALIFTALFALFGINNSCLGRRSFPIFFAPWIFVCCSILVMDILATTYYIMDSVSVTSNEGLMTLLEIGNTAEVGPVFAKQLRAILRLLPPIIMLVTTSKLFVFLIFDIVVIVLVTKSGWAIANYHKYVDDTIRQYSQNLSRTNPGFESSQNDVSNQKQQNQQFEFVNGQRAIKKNPERSKAMAEPETPIRYNDTSVQAFVYPYKEPTEEKNTNRDQNLLQRPSSLALNSKLNEPQQNSNNQRTDNTDIDTRLSHFVASNGNVIRSVEHLKDEDFSERPQQPARVRVMPIVAELNRNSIEPKQRPPVPPKPVNPNRVSQNPSFGEERPGSRIASSKIDRNSSMNSELRGQHPWSYFKSRDDIPKKAFTDLNEDEELPRVPVPDYTLHFPKAKRVNLSDSDGDGSWSRYDQNQRY